jgi:hypothetical protein
LLGDGAEQLARLGQFGGDHIGAVGALFIHVARQRAGTLAEEMQHVAGKFLRVLDAVRSVIGLAIVAIGHGCSLGRLDYRCKNVSVA